MKRALSAPASPASSKPASPATRCDDDRRQQQATRNSRTPTRSSASSTPRRSVPLSREASSGSWGRAAVDVPRIQIRAKSPGEGGGGREARAKSPWGQPRAAGVSPRAAFLTRTPLPRSFSAQHKEGGGGGQHQYEQQQQQQRRLSSRSPRSSFDPSHQKQRLVPSVILRCGSSLSHPPCILNPPPDNSLDDTIPDDNMHSAPAPARPILKVCPPSQRPLSCLPYESPPVQQRMTFGDDAQGNGLVWGQCS